jgi:replicative DNA helicase
MLGDYFIDQTLIAGCSLNPKKVKESKDIFKIILEIIENYISINEKKLKSGNPENSEKLELINLSKLLIEYRLKNINKFNLDNFLEGLNGGKFDHYISFLENKRSYLEKEDINHIKDLIYKKKKLLEFFKEKENLNELLVDFESGNYSDEDEIVDKWEHAIKNINNSFNNINSKKLIEEGSTLNFLEDDFDSTVENLINSLNVKNAFKSGFKSIDSRLPSGGFESRRLYLIGGCSGVGKSIFLLNLIKNGVMGNISSDGTQVTGLPIIYITAENLIYESLLRLYCCFTGESISSIVCKLKSGILTSDMIKTYFLEKQKKSKTPIIFKYVKPLKTKTDNIEVYLKEEYEKYGGIRCVLIDYLDLIKTDYKEEIRIEQGMVAQEFKNFGVMFNTPIITATQLNRSGYNPDLKPSLVQMGESMKKIDNSDFVLFLQNDVDPTEIKGVSTYKKVRMTILKNRNGAVGETINLYSLISENNTNAFNYIFNESTEKLTNNLSLDQIYSELEDLF